MREALIARADAIAGLVEGMVLIKADRTIDDARRLAYACYYDGRTFEDQADALGCDQTARAIALALEGMTPMHVTQVLERVRWACWQARYQGTPYPRGGEVH